MLIPKISLELSRMKVKPKIHIAMTNHCHGKHQTSVPENAFKQQFWRLILGELLQVTLFHTQMS